MKNFSPLIAQLKAELRLIDEAIATLSRLAVRRLKRRVRLKAIRRVRKALAYPSLRYQPQGNGSDPGAIQEKGNLATRVVSTRRSPRYENWIATMR